MSCSTSTLSSALSSVVVHFDLRGGVVGADVAAVAVGGGTGFSLGGHGQGMVGGGQIKHGTQQWNGHRGGAVVVGGVVVGGGAGGGGGEKREKHTQADQTALKNKQRFLFGWVKAEWDKTIVVVVVVVVVVVGKRSGRSGRSGG